LTGGLGLDCFALDKLFTVEETGMRGGGTPSCFDGWAVAGPFSLSVSDAVAMPLLELPRFHDILSFLLSEVIEDGVAGSSTLDRGAGDLVVSFSIFGGLGPAGF
jgi:hypothetical protein